MKQAVENRREDPVTYGSLNEDPLKRSVNLEVMMALLIEEFGEHEVLEAYAEKLGTAVRAFEQQIQSLTQSQQTSVLSDFSDHLLLLVERARVQAQNLHSQRSP